MTKELVTKLGDGKGEKPPFWSLSCSSCQCATKLKIMNAGVRDGRHERRWTQRANPEQSSSCRAPSSGP